MLFEFTMSLNFMPFLVNDYDEISRTLEKYHTGIVLLKYKNDEKMVFALFTIFLPQIMIVFTIINILQFQIIAGLTKEN